MDKLLQLDAQPNIDVEFRFVLEFKAKVFDKRTNAVVSEVDYAWKLLGPLNNPRVETTLKPKGQP